MSEWGRKGRSPAGRDWKWGGSKAWKICVYIISEGRYRRYAGSAELRCLVIRVLTFSTIHLQLLPGYDQSLAARDAEERRACGLLLGLDSSRGTGMGVWLYSRKGMDGIGWRVLRNIEIREKLRRQCERGKVG